MKRNLISVPFLLYLLVAVAACKKDDAPQEEEDLGKPKVDLIVKSSWRIVFVGEDTNGDGVFDPDDIFENILADCMFDDDYIFRADSTFSMVPGDVSNGCGDTGYTEHWEMSKNGVNMVYGAVPSILQVLDEHTMQFYEMQEGYNTTYIFKR